MNLYSTQGYPTVIGDTVLGEPPDFFQGFGRVMLSNVLPLKGTTHPSFQLFVQDRFELQENKVAKFTVEVTNSSVPLTFTISWYDPPNVFWSGKAVLNDLGI
jgi:hypothetical protein